MGKKVGVVIAASLVAIAAVAPLRRAPGGPAVVGKSAPGFSVPRVGGGALRLASFRGRVVLLNFWATWCPPCVVEAPSLEWFATSMQPHGVQVISVSVDQHSDALQKFISSYHLTYPIGRDPDQLLAHRYGTVQYPETYIIDRSGRVAEKIVGAINWQDPRIVAFVGDLAEPGRFSLQPATDTLQSTPGY